MLLWSQVIFDITFWVVVQKEKKRKMMEKVSFYPFYKILKEISLDIFHHFWIVCFWCRIKEVKIGLLIFRMVFPKPRQHFPAFFRRNWHERCTMFLPKVSLRCVEKMLHIILTIEESNAVGCSFVVSQNFLAIRLLNYRFMNMESKKKSQSFWCEILFFFLPQVFSDTSNYTSLEFVEPHRWL